MTKTSFDLYLDFHNEQNICNQIDPDPDFDFYIYLELDLEPDLGLDLELDLNPHWFQEYVQIVSV